MLGVPPNILMGEVEWYIKSSDAITLDTALNDISENGWTVFAVNTLTAMPYDNRCYQIIAYRYNKVEEKKR